MIHRTLWTLPLILFGAAACNSDDTAGAGTPAPLPGTAGGAAVSTVAGTGAGLPSAGVSAAAAGTGAAGLSGQAGTGAVATAGVGSALPAAGSGSTDPGTMPAAGSGGMPASCRGFSFEGLVYSPGGDVLPNTCEPFHATTNNPYAVRCVDAWPWYKTKYPGDDFCILPPPPDKGVQYGVHPQGKKWFEQVSKGDMSGYENIPGDFIMEDGEEEQMNYQTGVALPEAKNFYRNYPRMRGGSHHMIISTATGSPTEEVWGPASTAGLFSGTSLPGAQRPDENSPKSLNKPAEDAGLYSVLPANPSITFNMHHFNVTGKQILKEAWTNLWWETDARIPVYGIRGLEVGQVITMAIPPGATQDLHYSWNITQPIRMVTAFGHRHAWTSNFSAWVENPDGKLDIIYQSFHWLDEPTYRYDSETMNPVPAPDNRADGAHSGIRMLMPGQKLHFNCHIEFTDERAAKEMGPTPAEVGTLRFANEAFTAEMCILFGSTAQTMLPAPVIDTTPLPPFATVD